MTRRPLVIVMKLDPTEYHYYIEEHNVEIAGPFDTIEDARATQKTLEETSEN